MSDKLKQEEIEKAIADKVAELKTYVGKWFVKNDDTKSTPVKIESYAGVIQKDFIPYHTFQVEGKDARWKPIASQFLADYHEVDAPATATTIQIPQ